MNPRAAGIPSSPTERAQWSLVPIRNGTGTSPSMTQRQGGKQHNVGHMGLQHGS